jgi:cytochrome P450
LFEPLRPGLHVVRGYDDARKLLADPRFVHWLPRDGSGSPVRQAVARWLDAMDPRRNQPVRSSLVRALAPAACRTAEPRMRQIADALLATAPTDAPFDIEAGFARPLTHGLIADILGVDAALRPQLDGFLEALALHVPQALFSSAQNDAQSFFDDWERFMALVTTRSPDRGLAAAIRADLVRAGAARDHGVFTAMFAFAATQNIARLIARMCHGLHGRPETWRRLNDERAGIAPVVEEWLRLDPPLQWVHLVANETVAGDHGAVIAGDSVMVSLADANRDAKHFTAPADFHPDRRALPHIAFGSGPLACIGAAVARMLAAVAIQGLLARFEPAAGAIDAFPLLRLAPRSQAMGMRADAST